MKKRILVTGGAGFIGSHLSEYLLNAGNEVICIDNYFTGSKQNVSHLFSNPDFELIRHDVTIPLNIECDQIYNLACPASPFHYQRYPVQTINTSVMGAINALELARRIGIPVLQASTSEVYGDPLTHPQTESYNGNCSTTGIRACYDESKRCAETLFSDYHRQYGVKIKIARIFNTYGPRLSEGDGRVVSNFILQALRDQDITIYGDGSQTRSFMYIDDLIQGLTKLMAGNILFPVNLGNNYEITINELSRAIIHLTNSKSKVIHKNLPDGDPVRRRPDITLASEHLGWKPAVDLETGLTKTIEYFESVIKRRIHDMAY